jgi:hypothetical protein
MIFVLSIVAVFVAVSIYFFFKAENLQRELILMRRDISDTKKENKVLIESTALIAQRYEEFYKQRLLPLRDGNEDETLKVITPVINNYTVIFNECIRSKGKLQPTVKKVYEGYQEGSFKTFSNLIARSDTQIKRAWSSNNLNGFIALVEALVIEQNSQERSTKLAAK